MPHGPAVIDEVDHLAPAEFCRGRVVDRHRGQELELPHVLGVPTRHDWALTNTRGVVGRWSMFCSVLLVRTGPDIRHPPRLC